MSQKAGEMITHLLLPFQVKMPLSPLGVPSWHWAVLAWDDTSRMKPYLLTFCLSICFCLFVFCSTVLLKVLKWTLAISELFCLWIAFELSILVEKWRHRTVPADLVFEKLYYWKKHIYNHWMLLSVITPTIPEKRYNFYLKKKLNSLWHCHEIYKNVR